MTKIEEIELKLVDANLHLENAKAFLQIYGLTSEGLAIFLDARKEVARLNEELAYLKANQEWLKSRFYTCSFLI